MRARFLVPEVIQTSAMDCGPAALKAICEGFGIEVSYGRLREACQTEVDGTSIDALEEVAGRLGLDAEQVMIPVDHLLLPEAQALPALAVAQLANGVNHFVVIWRCHGALVQIMDPGAGRRWVGREELQRQLFVHDFSVPAESWRAWAGTEDFLGPLKARLSSLGFGAHDAGAVTKVGLQSPDWRSLAALDAAGRLVSSLVRDGGVKRGANAVALVKRLHQAETVDRNGDRQGIPIGFWSVSEDAADDTGTVRLRGAVLIRFRGPSAAVEVVETAAQEAPSPTSDSELFPDLASAAEGQPPNPVKAFLDPLKEDGVFAPLAVLAALATSAGIVLFEGLAFRALLDAAAHIGLGSQRAVAMAMLCALVVGLIVVEAAAGFLVLRSGRRLETGFWLAILRKIPRLADRYFHSRLISDMADRAHNIHLVRELPNNGAQFLRTIFQIVLTTAAIIWIDQGAALAAIAVAVLALGLPLLCQHFVIERDLAVRTHAGALSRFSLDALLGSIPIRSHSAGTAVRREHEGLLVEWTRAGFGLLRAAVSVEAVLEISGFFLAVWLVIDHLQRNGQTGMLLLLVYWSLSLPVLGRHAAMIVRQYPAQRNTILRLLEPLGAPEEVMSEGQGQKDGQKDETRRSMAPGIAIAMEKVSVQVAGHTLLEEIDLQIASGSHVAIIGPSGAGKSSLVSLLLGWLRPASGRITLDGSDFDGRDLDDLRRVIAWVDPTTQIWNRSFIDNLRYGGEQRGEAQLVEVLEAAELLEILEGLPDGMQTVLGEGGGLLSGGEGQRLRLGRATMRSDVKLVILDEPFRGLDRRRRTRLLATARRVWQQATLICVTHDIEQTTNFDQVIVVESGRVVESGAPSVLSERESSRYRALLDADVGLRGEVWGEHQWQSLELRDGNLCDLEAGRKW